MGRLYDAVYAIAYRSTIDLSSVLSSLISGLVKSFPIRENTKQRTAS
jgi:hypothetical protein